MPYKQTLILFLLASALVSGFLAKASPAFGASSEQVLYSFCPASGCPDGRQPGADLIFDKHGNLYGTTEAGGRYRQGTVFELIPNNGTWTEKVLHSFNPNGQDGYFPGAALIFDAAGNLYGTTLRGGASSNCYDGCGTVFELTPGTNGKWTEKILHEFNGTDGYLPATGLILDAAGNLYGTTLAGGSSGNYGTVFELVLGNGKWTEKVLHEFNGKNGSVPNAGLILDKAGNLYGITSEGGVSNYGTVFQLVLSNGKWMENVLHEFNGTNGSVPGAGLIFDRGGNLYGTTEFGGAHNEGTVFQLIPSNGKWTAKVLHSFNGTDGYLPRAALMFDAAGKLYGTTILGGTYGNGTVFELTPNNGTWTETVLHSFDAADGRTPYGGLILDGSGNLYGTTGVGGTYHEGAVFEVTP